MIRRAVRFWAKVALALALLLAAIDVINNTDRLVEAARAQSWTVDLRLLRWIDLTASVASSLPPEAKPLLSAAVPAWLSGSSLLNSWSAALTLLCCSLGLWVLLVIRPAHRRFSDSLRYETTSASPDKSAANQQAAARSISLDREFLPAALEIIETPPSPIRVAGIWFICTLFASVLLWSFIGEVEIHAIAQGRLQPSGRTKVIQPQDAGRVVAVQVENGSVVRAGDVVAELDATESGADRVALQQDLAALSAEVVRRRHGIAAAQSNDVDQNRIVFPTDVPSHLRDREISVLSAELGQLRANRASIAAQRSERLAQKARLGHSVASRQEHLTLLKERVDMRETLHKSGTASRASLVEILVEYQREATLQAGEAGQLHEVEAGVELLDRRANQLTTDFVFEQTQRLVDTERRLDRTSQELIKARSRNERTRLVAPIAGTIQQLALTTIGQIVAGGQSLMAVVPAGGTIEVEATVLNQDIGFVENGQTAVVKIDAFPFTKYGTIDATIIKVSRDAVEDRDPTISGDATTAIRGGATAGASEKRQNLIFPVTARLNKQTMNIDGKDITLSPGMTVTVEIMTGKRRIIDYILSPIRAVASVAGKER